MNSKRSPITTHVLDVAIGKPAAGVGVTLAHEGAGGKWTEVASRETDADGRVSDLLPPGAPLAIGTYRISFETGAYFHAQNIKGFYPRVEIAFEVADGKQHYHVPLLVSPYGYSTYRGS